MVRLVVFFLAVISMVSCGDRYDFSGFIFSPGDNVNCRFERSAGHIGKPMADIVSADEYLFYVCTDVHVSETADNLQRFMRDFRNDPLASFGLCLGDCIDVKGKMKSFAGTIQYDPLRDSYDHPLYTAVGNHDTYFSQWDEFYEYVGPSCYYFTVSGSFGKDLFICLDSASGTFGRKQLEWLEGFLERERGHYRHVFVFTHTDFFNTDGMNLTSGNYMLDETYFVADLFDRSDVSAVFQGHIHSRNDLWFRDVRYTVVGALKDGTESPEYLKVKVSAEGFGYEWVLL